MADGDAGVRLPRQGEVVELTTHATVPEVEDLKTLIRVSRFDYWPRYEGWGCLHGDVLDAAGEPLHSIHVFLFLSHLEWVSLP
jgi:hypothetical protein